MNWLKHYQKYQTTYMLAGFALFFFVNALTLASSRIMEAVAAGDSNLPFQVWEPFLWEFSSAAMILALVPMVNALLQSSWMSWEAPIKTLIALLIGAAVFSALHVTGMVLIREVVYAFAGGDYRFGNIWFGFIYEFRKDILTFIVLVVAIKGYRFVSSQLSGEANLVHQGDVQQGEQQTILSDRLLVRKLGKEFIVKVGDIDWLESSGNYVNLHVSTSVYPIRSTMSELIKSLGEYGFYRTHRSFGINLDRVASIDVHENGGGEVTLVSGKSIPMSRKFREGLKMAMK